MKEKKIQKKYEEEFKRQAVELVIHSGKAGNPLTAIRTKTTPGDHTMQVGVME